MGSDESYQAIVHNVIKDGKHGPYAVANSETLGSITFSLDSNVWQEKNWPERGTYVMLSQITRKRAGWRAQNGRFVEPSDYTNNPSKSNTRKQ